MAWRGLGVVWCGVVCGEVWRGMWCGEVWRYVLVRCGVMRRGDDGRDMAPGRETVEGGPGRETVDGGTWGLDGRQWNDSKCRWAR